MTETRDFPIAALASLSSGVLLCNFAEVQAAAEFILGHPIWTHHFADKQLIADLRRALLDQCPGLPTELKGGPSWRDELGELERRLGTTAKIRRGSGLTALLPTDGIDEKKVIKVIV